MRCVQRSLRLFVWQDVPEGFVSSFFTSKLWNSNIFFSFRISFRFLGRLLLLLLLPLLRKTTSNYPINWAIPSLLWRLFDSRFSSLFWFGRWNEGLIAVMTLLCTMLDGLRTVLDPYLVQWWNNVGKFLTDVKLSEKQKVFSTWRKRNFVSYQFRTKNKRRKSSRVGGRVITLTSWRLEIFLLMSMGEMLFNVFKPSNKGSWRWIAPSSENRFRNETERRFVFVNISFSCRVGCKVKGRL